MFGGSLTASGLSICGPVCEVPPTGCTRTASQFINVCVPVTITPIARTGRATTICCGDAAIGTECDGVQGDTCFFTISQLICVEVPVHFRARASSDPAYVDCETASIGECICPDDTENDGD